MVQWSERPETGVEYCLVLQAAARLEITGTRPRMRNSIENNFRKWNDDYDWPKDGDEWDGQARFSGQPYEAWKDSIVATFLAPNLSPESVVLEIAPGHGRWSNEIVDRCGRLILVDLSPNCIEFCQRRFASHDNVEYLVNDGRSLQGVADDSVDFVWSYDAFVHIGADVIDHYLRELRRVLKPGGQAAIHHAGRTHSFLWLGFLRDFGALGTNVYKALSMGKVGDDDGWRSNVSQRTIRQLATHHGLRVQDQLQTWGKNNEFGLERYGDFVTTLIHPPRTQNKLSR
jgi:ubiquinone/menaquinone biosynthesis C-methylase UbiE